MGKKFVEDGSPEGFAAGFSDDAMVEFLGPHAPLAPDGTPMKIPASMMKPVATALTTGFSDFTFNPEAKPFTQREDGSWSATFLVKGTHDGTYQLPDLPPLEASGKECVMGPETFSFYFNDEGKVTKKVIEPLHAGPSGPPGMYVLAGGVIPPKE